MINLKSAFLHLYNTVISRVAIPDSNATLHEPNN
jgi:hypothetical protein